MAFASKAKPLAGKRQAILETIKEAPGINFLNIAHAHQMAMGEAMHHLAVLEAHRLVFSARVGRFRRYWPATAGYGPGRTVTAAADPLRRAVLDRIRAAPGASLGELAAAFPDRSRQATGYHVAQLERDGCVVVDRSAKPTAVWLAPAPEVTA
jgi:predicted transcriptional regulator